jgi:hypothetical protein
MGVYIHEYQLRHTTLPLKCPIEACYVQDFTPCQLRFTVLLLTDGWIMAVACVAMGLAVARQVYMIASLTQTPADSHESDAAEGCSLLQSCDSWHSGDDGNNQGGCAAEVVCCELEERGGGSEDDDEENDHDNEAMVHKDNLTCTDYARPTGGHSSGWGQCQPGRRQRRSGTMTEQEIQRMLMLQAQPSAQESHAHHQRQDSRSFGSGRGYYAAQDQSADGSGGQPMILDGPGHAGMDEDFATALAASSHHHQSQQVHHNQQGLAGGPSPSDDETLAMFARAKEAAGFPASSSSSAAQQTHSYVARNERLGEMI